MSRPWWMLYADGSWACLELYAGIYLIWGWHVLGWALLIIGALSIFYAGSLLEKKIQWEEAKMLKEAAKDESLYDN